MLKLRYHSLDSLRGIASLQVVISHGLVAIPTLFSIVYNDPKTIPHNLAFFLTHSPLSFFWSDSAAVKVFFVLSGFVLSLPYYTAGKNKPHYPEFFFKRIIRLYLPCLIIILISLLGKYLLYVPNRVNHFAEWVRLMWSMPVNASNISSILLLNTNMDAIDRPLWTLPPEIKLSLILPFAVYLIKRFNAFCSISSVVIFAALWHAFNKIGTGKLWPDFFVLYYFTFFLAGSVVCKYKLVISEWINKLSVIPYCLFAIAALYLYTFNYSCFWLPEKLYHFLSSKGDYVTAIAAIMVLSLTIGQRAQLFLNSKPLVFIGKISFSLYLVHTIVMTVLAYLIPLNPIAVILLAVLLSFPVSVLFYNWVEVPSMRIAGYCSKKIVSNLESLFQGLFRTVKL